MKVFKNYPISKEEQHLLTARDEIDRVLYGNKSNQVKLEYLKNARRFIQYAFDIKEKQEERKLSKNE